MISVRDLCFDYGDAGAIVLDIPRWSVRPCEQVFLHGPSGAGKSTLLNLLSGILLPQTGTVEILGHPINTMSARQRDKWRARHVGIVFQQFNLIPYLCATDNIKLAAHFADSGNPHERAHNLLNKLNIDESERRRPAARLSIGQQQRVAIARAMINQPELLIVDEPTSALDRENRELFMSLLFEQVELNQTALVFVSHDPSLASSFSRVDSLANINQNAGAF